MLQYGQARSLTAKGFAGVLDSAIEPGVVATGASVIVRMGEGEGGKEIRQE